MVISTCNFLLVDIKIEYTMTIVFFLLYPKSRLMEEQGGLFGPRGIFESLGSFKSFGFSVTFGSSGSFGSSGTFGNKEGFKKK